MLQSNATLFTAQSARAASLPSQLDAPTPAREALLESFRQRNALLDWMFYDIGCVSPDEAKRLAPRWAAEGAILIVPPSGQGEVQLCASIDQFVANGGDQISTLVVAGVGSSALGSAAFARNVADAIGGPVAAVVSGYGLSDLMTEALGGFFWFGLLNQVRHNFEAIDRWTKPKAIESADELTRQTNTLTRLSLDTRTVAALLADTRLGFSLLCGHSKGNLVISEALYGLSRQDGDLVSALAARAKIVTVSARVAMPPAFKDVVDIMGGWDWFGGLNSRADIGVDLEVKYAWHHTNTELPAHLPVTKTLKSALVQH